MVVSHSSWRRSGLPRVKAGEMPDDTITSTNPLPNTGPHLVPLYPNPTTNWRIGRRSTSARPLTPSPLFRVTHLEEIAYLASCRFMRHSFSRGYTQHASKNSTHGPRALYGQSPSNLPHEIATTEIPRETLSTIPIFLTCSRKHHTTSVPSRNSSMLPPSLAHPTATNSQHPPLPPS